MNYAGKFDATFASEGPGTHSHAYMHVDSSQTHAPADAVIVPDAQLLFHADYSRSGRDLILSRDHHEEYVVHDYFRGEKRAPLASADGAHLTADIVKALVGEVEVSQAGAASAASQVIGHVTKLQGSATVIRNGVSIILNIGDNVEKGDVVQSGASSTVGISFIDGTVFGLSSNARMVLNEMVYDPNGSNNSSLLSLVAGTITFVAGETAKHGDMKVDTPVATMGIRGTAVLVEIDFTVPGQSGQPNASFQVLVEPDGTTGSYILFDKTTLQPIAIVNQAGQQVNINNGIINITTNPLTPELQKLITDVFQQKFTDNTNTKSTSPSTDSIIPTSSPLIIKLAETLITTQTVTVPGSSTPPPPPTLSDSPHHIAGPPAFHITNAFGVETTSFFASGELPGVTGSLLPDGAGGIVSFSDINLGDRPTVSAAFSSFVYKNAHGQDVTGALSPLQLAGIAATEVNLNLVQGANNTNIGSALFTYGVADHAFDFLAAGEQITLTYVITINDNYTPAPDIVNVPVTITITGTNDVPVITTSARSITFIPSGTNTKGGDLQTSNPTSGVLAFTDVDLTDTHTVATALTGVVMSNGGTLPPLPESVFEHALIASIGTDSTGTGKGTVDWQLAPLQAYLADFIPPGQTVTLTYTVTVTDSQGAIATQTVTVVIPGDENPAVVWIHTTTDGHDNLWSDKLNWGTGTVPTSTDDVIISTDQLHPNTPSYPALIDGNTAAVANSVTMNDHVNLPPELDVALGGSLAIGAGLSMSADSILKNAGTLSIGGKAELLDSFDGSDAFLALNQSVIVNSGTLSLGQGGDFQGLASITNTGIIDLQGGILNVTVDIANSVAGTDDEVLDGQITVELGAKLALGTDANTGGGSGGITGGTLTIIGELDLQGSNFVKDGTLDNGGNVYLTGLGNAFDGETITNTGLIEVRSGAGLTIDQGSSVSGGGTITIDATATLTLDDATIGGNTVDDNSSTGIHVTGDSTIDGSAALNNGTVNVDAKLTLDTMTVSGTTINDNSDGSIELDHTVQLTNGATIQGQSKTQLGVITNLGLLEILGAATLLDVSVTNTGHNIQVDTNQILDFDNSTITSGILTVNGALDSTGTSFINNATIINQNNIHVISGTLTIDPTEVTNTGSILVDSHATLDLQGSEIDGGKVTIDGELDSSGNSTISGATIVNDGIIDIKDGILTIDATSVLTGTGGIKMDGGSLDLKAALAGDIDIGGAATVELGSSSLTAYSSATVIFDQGSTGTLKLDYAEDFRGHVAGFTIGQTLDLADIAYSSKPIVVYTGDASGGVLAVYVGGQDVANINLTGNYTGVQWVLSSDGKNGTDIGESTGGVLAATLDHSTAQQGVTMHVTGVTDGGIPVSASNLSYAWQMSTDGKSWTTVGTLASFTPGEAQEGHFMQLVVTDTNAGTTQDVVYQLGMPNDLAVTVDQTTAQQGLPIRVTGVTDGGAPVSSGVTYLWETSSDNGHTWTEVGHSSSYTPSFTNDGGKLLQLVVGYSDPGESESVTESFGTVALAKEWTSSNHSWETSNAWSAAGAPTSPDNAVVDANGHYTVTVDQASAAAHSLVENASQATVEIVHGGTLTLGGNLVIDQGNFQVDIGGTLKDVATSATISGSFTNYGMVEAGGGKLEITDAVSGFGSFKIDSGATLQLDHASSANVMFSGQGTLALENPTHFTGFVSDSTGSMTDKDVLDLAGFDTKASVTYVGGTSLGVVVVSENNKVATIAVGANTTHWTKPVSDGHGGILIEDPVQNDAAPNANAAATPALADNADKGTRAPTHDASHAWSTADGFVFKTDPGANIVFDADHSPIWPEPDHPGSTGNVAQFLLNHAAAELTNIPHDAGTPDSLKIQLLLHHNEFHFV